MRHQGVVVGSWEDLMAQSLPGAVGVTSSRARAQWTMSVLAGRGPGDAGESLPGTDMWRAAVLQISPRGETQAGNKNLLQHLCSLRWERSAGDEALDSPGCPLFLWLHCV